MPQGTDIADTAREVTQQCASTSRRRATSCWAEELRDHERTRRRHVDPEYLKGPTVPINSGFVKHQERAFDTVLGRYRDNRREAAQRTFEDSERVKHLNRARDIQVLRERPFHLITGESRLGPLGGETKAQLTFGDPNTTAMPPTAVDYNIVSNVPFHKHHWADPDLRPHVEEKQERRRKIPAINVKDFNVLTNRYLSNHEAKATRDQDLNLLEATSKFRTQNRFDPVLQRFTDARAEECARTCDDAREVEVNLRARASEPPSHHGRLAASYDVVSHEAKDPDMLSAMDHAAQSRVSRFRTRYDDSERRRAEDIEFEDAIEKQKNEQVSHERFNEVTRRGYDIVTNQGFGRGRRQKALHPPYTVPGRSPWEDALQGHEPENAGTNAPSASDYEVTQRRTTARSGGQSGTVSHRGPAPSRASLAEVPCPKSARGSERSFRSRSSCSSMARALAGAAGTLRPEQVATIRAPPPPPVPGASGLGAAYSHAT